MFLAALFSLACRRTAEIKLQQNQNREFWCNSTSETRRRVQEKEKLKESLEKAVKGNFPFLM